MTSTDPTTRFAIVTPAFNEAATLGRTIESVLGQTVRPAAWAIVDDGSTDGTGEAIDSYAARHDWIAPVRRVKTPGQSYFGSNVAAIGAGVERLRDVEFDYLAILDADITLPADYYETILARMARDAKLGIASGIYENLVDGRLEPVIHDRRSTPKAIMVFRRAVYEEIGGFLPLDHGGEDTAACIMARMRGWKTWSFPDIKVVHHRPTGTGEAGSVLRARFRAGENEYGLGSHPLFVALKCVKRALLEKPYGVGGAARLAGYLSACMRRPARQAPADVRSYYRNEQIVRVVKGNKIPDNLRVEVQ